MAKFLSVMRWIIVAIALLEILGALFSLSTNLAPSVVRLILWPTVIGICLYFETKANKNKSKSKKS